jgi:multidrug efflux pump subunit AcrA (membrane-fusion protein)
MKRRLLVFFVVIAGLSALAWGALQIALVAARGDRAEIPTTGVKRGRVTITVSARGELQGGNSEMLPAPMVGGGEMVLTYLRTPGDVVQPGDIVAQFDTTQQEFNMREAEADLAEADQQVIKAEADAEAALEEARYQTISTAANVKLAELEVRKNPFLAPILARQNEISLEAAKNRQQQAERDYENRQLNMGVGIDIQRAAVAKAKVAAETARSNMDSMIIKAKSAGYVSVQANSNQNMIFWGQELPPFKVGDAARAGQAVAQIPDMRNWEVRASIPELDRGHLAPGQEVSVRAAALPGRVFKGRIKSLSATTGSAWERTFECRIVLTEFDPQMRPGMTSNILISVESLEDVLWTPSQALFESDGRAFVYVRTPEGFTPRDVKLVRRSESQAVIEGLHEGELVALSNPDRQDKSENSGQQGVMKALPK